MSDELCILRFALYPLGNRNSRRRIGFSAVEHVEEIENMYPRFTDGAVG